MSAAQFLANSPSGSGCAVGLVPAAAEIEHPGDRQLPLAVSTGLSPIVTTGSDSTKRRS